MSNEADLVKEIDSDKDKYLKELRDALNKQSIASNFELSDEFLLKFLRCRLFNVNSVCNLLKNYIENFRKYPNFFKGIDYCEPAVVTGFFYLLPDSNVTGERIAILSPGMWDPNELPFEALVAATVCGFEAAELAQQTQFNGIIEIIDFANVGFKQFIKIGIKEIRLLTNMTEASLPIRWRKIFLCNQNYFVDILYKMGKPFLSKEFKQRIEFIGQDYSRIHKVIPQELLPEKYGGTLTGDNPRKFLDELKAIEPELNKMWSLFKQF